MLRNWLTGFLIYLKKALIFILLLAVFLVLIQYLSCPVYRFPEPKPFSGAKFFNPYQDVDSNNWRRANFQVQSYAWGGVTDGRNNSNELIDSVYRLLGYDIIATSDYQRINRWGDDKVGFIPVYEHGYGVFKNHQVMIGAQRVLWADFPVFQNLNHKQHILNSLRDDNALAYIAHPDLSKGYKPGDMKYLSGYQGIEVLNYQVVSESHWDSALSAGRYVTVMGNDDSHDVNQPLEVGHRCTYIWSHSLARDSIIHALRGGKAYAADIFRTPEETIPEKAERAKRIPKLKSFDISGDTVRVSITGDALFFRFVGQHGKVREMTGAGRSAIYVFKPGDTYIRTEIVFPDRNVFYLNPVCRYDGAIPANPPAATVDRARSWIFWILSWATVVFLAINVFFLRKKIKESRWTIWGYLAGNRFRKYLLILVGISFAGRAFLAAVLELGNDEVYYWTYALLPDLSHFDHPPMVGWVIQLFTLNLTFQDEFFLRLPGLVLGSLSTLLVYHIGKILRDELTGWYAALLFTASIYCYILSGTFILPDTPQLFFWLAAVCFFIPALKGAPDDAGMASKMLLAGVMTGLAMLSKYTSVFLWAGALLFILFKNRSWFRSIYLYLALLLSGVLFLPVLIWNFRNDFVSFTFQGSRAGFFQDGLRPDHFLTELGGEVLYNNPVVFLLILLAVIALARGKRLLKNRTDEMIILAWSVPLIAVFLFLSLFRPTLPHWTGPAYTMLIFLAAGYMTSGKRTGDMRLLPAWPATALAVLLAGVIAGVLQVNHGIFYTGRENEMTRRGMNDVSMDMYGWDQVSANFRWLAADDQIQGFMREDAPIVTFRWFPAANLDYYVARYSGKNVLALGPLESIHKYQWINAKRGGLEHGMDAYFITTSRDYKDPHELFGQSFRDIEKPYHFPIMRGGKEAGYCFIYKMKGYGMTSP